MPEGDGVLPGSLLAGRYRLGGELGHGGMSTVYRAWDEKLGRSVAIKVFASDRPIAADRQRRLREAQVLASASHPHLVTLFDAEWPASPDSREPAFLVMELIEGESLRHRLDARGPDAELALTACRDLGAALAYLHGRGIVHRDVKPENILIEDASGSVKLVDFGIARLGGSEQITTAGLVLGTAAYLSPEQVSGHEVGPESDVYSLGLVVLECVTGHREYPGPASEAAVARLVREPAIPDALPEGWRTLLAAMTDREPGARPTAEQIVASFGALLDPAELPIIRDTRPVRAAMDPAAMSTAAMSTATMYAEPTTPLTRSAPPITTTGETERIDVRPRRRRGGLALAAGLIVLAIAGGAIAWTSLSGRHDSATHTPVPTVVVTTVSTPSPAPAPAEEPATGPGQKGNGKPGPGNNGNGNNGNGGNGNGNNGNGGRNGK